MKINCTWALIKYKCFVDYFKILKKLIEFCFSVSQCSYLPSDETQSHFHLTFTQVEGYLQLEGHHIVFSCFTNGAMCRDVPIFINMQRCRSKYPSSFSVHRYMAKFQFKILFVLRLPVDIILVPPRAIYTCIYMQSDSLMLG